VVVLRQEAAAVWDVAEAPQQEAATSDAVGVPPQEVEAAAWDVAAEPQREVVAVASDAAVVPRQEVVAAAALLQGAAPDVRAALPSAVPWVFRRGPPPLWLAPRPAAQLARAMARSQIATP
jgi:hypothetical protein